MEEISEEIEEELEQEIKQVIIEISRRHVERTLKRAEENYKQESRGKPDTKEGAEKNPTIKQKIKTLEGKLKRA